MFALLPVHEARGGEEQLRREDDGQGVPEIDRLKRSGLPTKKRWARAFLRQKLRERHSRSTAICRARVAGDFS